MVTARLSLLLLPLAPGAAGSAPSSRVASMAQRAVAGRCGRGAVGGRFRGADVEASREALVRTQGGDNFVLEILSASSSRADAERRAEEYARGRGDVAGAVREVSHRPLGLAVFGLLVVFFPYMCLTSCPCFARWRVCFPKEAPGTPRVALRLSGLLAVSVVGVGIFICCGYAWGYHAKFLDGVDSFGCISAKLTLAVVDGQEDPPFVGLNAMIARLRKLSLALGGNSTSYTSQLDGLLALGVNSTSYTSQLDGLLALGGNSTSYTSQLDGLLALGGNSTSYTSQLDGLLENAGELGASAAQWLHDRGLGGTRPGGDAWPRLGSSRPAPALRGAAAPPRRLTVGGAGAAPPQRFPDGSAELAGSTRRRAAAGPEPLVGEEGAAGLAAGARRQAAAGPAPLVDEAGAAQLQQFLGDAVGLAASTRREAAESLEPLVGEESWDRARGLAAAAGLGGALAPASGAALVAAAGLLAACCSVGQAGGGGAAVRRGACGVWALAGPLGACCLLWGAALGSLAVPVSSACLVLGDIDRAMVEDMRGALGLDSLPNDHFAMLTETVDKCLNPADPSVVSNFADIIFFRTRSGAKVTVREELQSQLELYITSSFDAMAQNIPDGGSPDSITAELHELVDTEIITPIDTIIDGMRCDWLTEYYQEAVWGVCYQGVVVLSQVSTVCIALGTLLALLTVIMYVLWRSAHDNVQVLRDAKLRM